MYIELVPIMHMMVLLLCDILYNDKKTSTMQEQNDIMIA